MPCQPSLAPGLTAYERLLFHEVPALLSGCGCDGARRDLEAALRSKVAEPDEIVDALDQAAEMALRQSALQDSTTADQTEKVQSLIRHLAQHEALQGKATIASGRHLQRAIEIAESLGRRVGPVGVVPS